MSGLPVTNTPGGVSIDLHTEMMVFDILPPAIREKLQNATFNYCAQEVFMAWVDSKMTDTNFIRYVMNPKFEADLKRNIQQ